MVNTINSKYVIAKNKDKEQLNNDNLICEYFILDRECG